MNGESDIRRSTIAGRWYPGEPYALRQMIDGFLHKVPERPLSGDLQALIAPHAGYQFSGQTAAHSYKHVLGKQFDAVVILGPSHFAWVGEFAVSSEQAYETPLGVVPVDATLVAELCERLPSLARVREPLATREGGQWEHSIEIQLPFLQVALGTFAFVPILMSADSLEACRSLGQAIAGLMSARHILLVASSDLNHLWSYRAVEEQDAEVIASVERFDLADMADVLLSQRHTVCGRAAILAAGAAAQERGARRVAILSHTNSGNVTGRRTEGTYTVGYLSAALV